MNQINVRENEIRKPKTIYFDTLWKIETLPGTVQTFLHTSIFCNAGWEVLNHGIRRVAICSTQDSFLMPLLSTPRS